MRVTEKGQVTIPKHIRDRLGIVPGSEVEFVLYGSKATLQRSSGDHSANSIKAEALLERMREMRGRVNLDGMDVDEYVKFVRS